LSKKVTVCSSITNSVFPEKLKEAQVVPLFKKNNSLDKCNNRPVSILPTISKSYERAIYEQTVTFFDKVFHPSLSAFRPGYGCQTALLKIIEDWKKALDENTFVAAILMDLWGTPLYMSSHSLIILPILTHCFLLER
jgi:hypothetical protein